MTKYHMQKFEREIHDHKVIQEILENGKFTTIALCRNNEPYIVTLSYGYDKERNSLYFHSANQGLKYKFLEENTRVCGTIIEDKGYNHNKCSHSYRSIVFWGRLYVVKDLKEKIHGFDILMNHLEEKLEELKAKFFKDPKVYKNTSILRFEIDEITGKGSL